MSDTDDCHAKIIVSLVCLIAMGEMLSVCNLKNDRYCGRFLDAYGRDRADEALLRMIAAAEAFG